MWARAQQFMTIFAQRGNRVIYVDPPFTYLSPLKDPSLRGQACDRLDRVSDSICVYSPPVFLPFGNIYRTINRFNQQRLAAALERVYLETGWRPTLCWTYLPNTVDLPLPGDTVLVYDCADEHTAFPGLINKDTVRCMERELFARAGVSLASAAELYRRKKGFAPGLVLVPNGADSSHFRQALEPGLPIPGDLDGLSRPLIGYIGAVSAWLDQEMLAAAARARPEWTFVIIGPVDTDVSLLDALPNVRLLGRRDYAQLPAYLKAFAAAVIPFKINDLTEGVNPVKLYEYLAAGRPVVSSALPEVVPFAPLVAVARDPAEFTRLLEEELAGDSPQKAAERQRAVEPHSWEAREELAWDAVSEHRRKKPL